MFTKVGKSMWCEKEEKFSTNIAKCVQHIVYQGSPYIHSLESGW